MPPKTVATLTENERLLMAILKANVDGKLKWEGVLTEFGGDKSLNALQIKFGGLQRKYKEYKDGSAAGGAGVVGVAGIAGGTGGAGVAGGAGGDGVAPGSADGDADNEGTAKPAKKRKVAKRKAEELDAEDGEDAQ